MATCKSHTLDRSGARTFSVVMIFKIAVDDLLKKFKPCFLGLGNPFEGCIIVYWDPHYHQFRIL